MTQEEDRRRLRSNFIATVRRIKSLIIVVERYQLLATDHEGGISINGEPPEIHGCYSFSEALRLTEQAGFHIRAIESLPETRSDKEIVIFVCW